jgi:methylated-DNA-protein-cysteine methyltransferase-like protein
MSYTLPTLPEDQQMPFYRTVWEIVRQVPEGKVTTFGQVASMIPTPQGVDPDVYAAFGAQWVGHAMNAVSRIDEKTVPWHRVINSKGGIAMADTNPASAIQRGRLRAEGIEFNAKELVDFNIVGWDGPDHGWIHANGLLSPRSIKKSGGKAKPAAKKATSTMPRSTASRQTSPPPVPRVSDDDDEDDDSPKYDPDGPQQLTLL